jgi:hypothetical protein
MEQEIESRRLTVLERYKLDNHVGLQKLPTAEELSNLDLEKLKQLIELQERQRQTEFDRALKFREMEHLSSIESGHQKDVGRKLSQELIVSTVQSCFKMLMSIGGLAAGTILAAKGNHEIGYFLIGGGMSAVATDVVGLMKGVRGEK